MNVVLFGCLLLMSALWGSAFAGIAAGLKSFSFGALALLRFGTASLCFIPILLLFKKRTRPEKRDVPFFFLLGLCGVTVYHLALNYGQTQTSAGTAGVLISTIPVINAILAHFILNDRLSLGGWGGMLVSFVGVAMVVMGEGKEVTFNFHALFILAAALSGALYTVLQKRLFHKYSALEVAAFSTWLGTFPLVVFAPRLAAELPRASSGSLWAGVYIGVFPAAVAYALFSYGLSKISVNRVSLYYYLIPVFGFLFAWLWQGEIPTATTLGGTTVVLAGIFFAERAKRRSAKDAPS